MAEENSKKHVKVVVLADIGRSPRMQYHALSLANNGFKVNIVTYVETTPLTEITQNPNIQISKLHPLDFNRGPQLLQYVAKTIWQSISLLLTLFLSGKCDYLLCQNPPAIPTLPVCSVYCLVVRAQLVLDWHNYAYSLMAMSLHSDHPLLWLATNIEKWFGKSAHHNLCVTYAMKEHLLLNWNIVATVLYDRPPKIFHPLTLEEKHAWFLKIGEQYPEFSSKNIEEQNNATEVTAFTQVVKRHVKSRINRPGLLFSSTSWTPDEDFTILMEALQVYETAFDLSKKLPNLICVITGKGPMKEHYIQLLASKNWQHVKVVTPWLEAGDYPTMVASADLGVCLHTSSSGLDLPMKVVDMFGAGLPVCAFDFSCLNELVEDGANGYTFKNSHELSRQIVGWFEDFPNNEKQNKVVEKMHKELVKFQEIRWEDNWNLRANKLFES